MCADVHGCMSALMHVCPDRDMDAHMHSWMGAPMGWCAKEGRGKEGGAKEK